MRNQFVLFLTKICLKNRSNCYTKCSMFSISIRNFFFHFHIFSFFFQILFFVFAFVSIISIVKINCINVYQRIISFIDRVNIEFVISKRNWKKTKNKLFEYSITKHQNFEFSIFYIQNHVQNQKKISNRLFVWRTCIEFNIWTELISC